MLIQLDNFKRIHRPCMELLSRHAVQLYRAHLEGSSLHQKRPSCAIQGIEQTAMESVVSAVYNLLIKLLRNLLYTNQDALSESPMRFPALTIEQAGM